MPWFNAKRNEAWAQLCRETGAELVSGGFWKRDKVIAKAAGWPVTLDTYTESSNNSHTHYTRLRAPFFNPDEFRFKVYRKGTFSGLGKRLGMQDVEVGDPTFDDAFILQGNDEGKLRSLLKDAEVQALMLSQPKLRLEVKDHAGWLGPTFPENADLLQFLAHGTITDVDRLKGLITLFGAVLGRLCDIGAAYAGAPEVAL